MTAYPTAGTIKQSHEKGASAFLTKPVDLQHLMQTIRDLAKRFSLRHPANLRLFLRSMTQNYLLNGACCNDPNISVSSLVSRCSYYLARPVDQGDLGALKPMVVFSGFDYSVRASETGHVDAQPAKYARPQHRLEKFSRHYAVADLFCRSPGYRPSKRFSSPRLAVLRQR
jgi:hypothetical protein